MQADTRPPYVVAVVLTWNDTDMSERCIRSVLDNDYAPKDIVLVDNGSEPPAAPVLEGRFPGLTTVRHGQNMGFTGGCNAGMQKALEMGADYVFLLNNDTIVHPAAISRLVNAMEDRPDAAFASAILLYPGEPKQVQFYRGHIRRNAAHHVHPGDGDVMTEEHRRTIDTEFAPACAVLIRAEALKQVGLFDERLFTNWEDYDWCLRFADAGWRLITVGTAEVIHAHGQTTGRISPFITYFFTRNRLICLFRHGSLGGILLNVPFVLRSFFWQVRNHGWGNWPAHKAMWRGVADFLLGVRGKGNVPSERKDRPAA